ncbi:MAG: YdbH domain-containing protein [Opitutae bacterium]|nr:YdbH domain-containing protein [Opitutae bacterium]
MDTRSAVLRRWLVWLGAFVFLSLLALYLLRVPLTGAAVAASLRLAGAGDVRLSVANASPWQLVLEDVGFSYRTQQFAARRVSMERSHWWQPTLGAVRVEGARVPVTIDGSDTNPWAWASYSGTGKPAAVAASMKAVPAEKISIDGQLIIHAAVLNDQALTVKFEAEPGSGNTWSGSVHATGPGISVQAEGSYGFDDQRLAFRVAQVSLELQPWQDFIQRLVVLPGGAWEISGRLTATADGTYAAKKLTAGGTVQLHDVRLANPARGFTAEGVEAELEFTDFNQLQTKPGALRVRELRKGGLVATDLAVTLALEGPERMAISRATLQTLGGRVSAEPFKVFPNQQELEATVVADGLDVEKIMALARDVPAKASGRVDGRLPIRIDESGLRLGTGWLQLKPGVYAEVQLQAAGLLTGGMAASNPSYNVLQQVETGLLRLRLTELRLEVRPPNAPPGRTATLHLAGEPADPKVKAPVTLDLNVNGPLEQLINFGLDRRLNFGTKP